MEHLASELGLGARPIGMALYARTHLQQHGIICVDEELRPLGTDMVIELALGGPYALQRTEALEVRRAYVGDEPVVGVGDRAELGDVPGVTCPHLDDHPLMLGAEAKQRQRHAYVVIEVALGVEDGVAGGEDGGRQLLGRRLAIGPRDRQDRRPQLPSMVGGQLL